HELCRYGTDEPNGRIGMVLGVVVPAQGGEGAGGPSGFRVFDETLADGGRVKAIVAPGMARASRRETDELTEAARRHGAKGLAHLAVEGPRDVRGPVGKFLRDDALAGVLERTRAGAGDLVLIVA